MRNEKLNKIASEMEIAPRYTLFTLFVLFKLLYTAQAVACMPSYETVADVPES